MLTPVEHLMLSVIALEALLLSEVRSGLHERVRDTGLASLLAADRDHYTRLSESRQSCTHPESSALHGSTRRPPPGAHDAADKRLRAAAARRRIKALTNDLRSVPSLDPVRNRLTGIITGNSNLDAGLPRHDVPTRAAATG
jgi:hypothetical protein